MRKIISMLIVITIFVTNLSATAYAEDIDSDPEVVFSTIPDNNDPSLMEENKDIKAWTVDENGNKKYVTPVNAMNNQLARSNSSSNSFVNGRLMYTFFRYDENVTKTQKRKFFVSEVTVTNKGKKSIPLKYTQNQQRTNSWSVEGKVELSADFSAAIFSKIQAKFGIDAKKSFVTTASQGVEFTMEVPAKSEGTIKKYYGGYYSGGEGEWLVEDVVSGNRLDDYYEEAGAWAVAPNILDYVCSTTSVK